MKLRILVRVLVLIAAFVASIVAMPSLAVWAQSEGAPGEGGFFAYQLPLASGTFRITQYPERALTATGRSADFACSHKSGLRNAEAYDLVPTGGSLPLPVLAVADGKVIYAGVEYQLITQGFGRYVLLEHEDGVRSLYAHLSSIPFTPAQMETYFAYRQDTTKTPLRVSAGSVIGYMGSTGEPGNHHLHFSLYSAVGRSGTNNLGTPLRADAYFPDFVLGSSEPAIAAPLAFSPGGCEGASFTSSLGAGEEGSGSIAGGLVPKFSSTTGSVTVKTGSLGFRILYERVNSLYAFSIGIGGILAFLLIIYAGVRYSLSLGNASKAKEALDQAQAALTGLLLLLALYPILYTVNPCIVDPLRMGDRRDKEGKIVRVPICAVSQLFGVGSGTVTVTAPTPTPLASSSGSSPVAWDWSVAFTDQDGRPIERAVKGQTLNLTAKTGPQTERVFFEIVELDSSVLTSDNIRTLEDRNAIEGKVGSDGIAKGEWTITQEDLKEGGDDFQNFGDFDFLLSARTESNKQSTPSLNFNTITKGSVIKVSVSEKKKPDPTPAPAPTPEPAAPVIPPFVPGQTM